LKVGIVGLGKMGLAIADRLRRASHEVDGYDPNQEAVEALEALGGHGVSSLEELAKNVDVVWLMVPSGEIVDNSLFELKLHMKKKIIIDGGNSKYTNTIERAKKLADDHVSLLDCGTSGGLAGRDRGFCLMVGGDRASYDQVEPILSAIAVPGGYAYVGPSGAGHYVKMIHNGIEYALLQSYGEGFNLLKNGVYKDLDLATIANLWDHGSIIRSYILQLSHEILKKDSTLEKVSGTVADSGMGRWTVELAEKEDIPVPLIKQALEIRKESQKTDGNYATKLVALLRNAFGGHSVEKK